MEHSAARRDAAALLEQATHRDKNVRAAVAPELRKLAADPAARKLIVAALTDPAWRIRFAAVRAVGFKGTNIAPPEAIIWHSATPSHPFGGPRPTRRRSAT
jgi:HEAT repeat protein